MPGMPPQGMPPQGMPGGPMGGPMPGPMGGPMGGAAPPPGGYGSYGGYPGAYGAAAPAANDPMWGYFTAIAGQVSLREGAGEPVDVGVAPACSHDNRRSAFLWYVKKCLSVSVVTLTDSFIWKSHRPHETKVSVPGVDARDAC